MDVDPVVGLVRERTKQPGLNSLSELHAGVVLNRMPFSEALATQFDYDAHFVLYDVKDEEGKPEYLRVNKVAPALNEIVAGGGSVNVNLLALDFDVHDGLGKKRRWVSGDEVTAFVQRLAQPELPEPTVFYTTAHGARLVYVLTAPVTPEFAEGLVAGIIRDFKNKGVAFDTACCDWSRLFRLPQVIRDTGISWEESFFELDVGGPLLDPLKITPTLLSRPANFAHVEVDIGDQPTPDECELMLMVRGKATEWLKTAKRYLKGRDLFPLLFESAPVDWEPGTRNTSLTKAVGSVCGLLYHREGASPERIYALFLSVLDQLEPDNGTTDWQQAGWEIIGRMWTAEASKDASAQIVQQVVEEKAIDTLGHIIKTAQEQYPNVDDLKKADTAITWMMRRLIAAAPRGLYVMRPDGEYSAVGVTKERLAAAVHHLGMDGVMRLTELRGDVWKTRDAQAVIDEYAIPVKQVECSPRIPHAHIRGEGEDSSLVLRVHRLRDIEPTRDEQVQYWLKLLFGDKNDEGTEWLAHSLDVSRGICALVLIGASGTGKGMLAAGLGECFESSAFNDGRALGKFNSGLLDSPLIVLDEGLPMGQGDGRRIDEIIRAMTVGGNLPIERKGLDIIHATIYPRMLVTSNNWDVLQQISGARDMTDEDILALETRLMVIKVNEDARRWLTANGNYALTKGWVDGTIPSKYKIARHIRWLYENRKPRSSSTSGRLVVEGSKNTELMKMMSVRTPAAQAILRCIATMVEEDVVSPGFAMHDNHVYVVPNGVTHFHERRLQQYTKLNITNKTVGGVLRKLCSIEPKNPTYIGTGGEKQRWWEVDIQVVLIEATYSGHPRKRLRDIYKARFGEVALAMLESSFDTEESDINA